MVNDIAIGLDSVVNREIIKAFSNHPNVQIQALAEKLLSAVLSGWERKSNITCYLGNIIIRMLLISLLYRCCLGNKLYNGYISPEGRSCTLVLY